MGLLNKIILADDSVIDQIIDEELTIKYQEATKEAVLGLGQLKSFKGMIPLETNIRFLKGNDKTYKMSTKDYYYLFAHQLKQNNIETMGGFMTYISKFLLDYFGYNKNSIDERTNYLTNPLIDEIGILKGKKVALSTEKSAVVQNLFSLFGVECYYCVGTINKDDKYTDHAFNIIKAKNEYVLLDYGMPCYALTKDHIIGSFPYERQMNYITGERLINGNVTEYFDDYNWKEVNNVFQKVANGKERQYRVGEFH